jgi:hypothetical protein
MATSLSETTLLPGEKNVVASDGDTIVLTNFRVRHRTSGAGKGRFLSITLDSVASCGVVTTSHPILLVIGVLSAVGGFVQNDDTVRFVLPIFGVLLLIAYALTRAAMLTISSNGGQHIAVPAKSMSRDAIIEFIDAVDQAKLAFMAGRTGAT